MSNTTVVPSTAGPGPSGGPGGGGGGGGGGGTEVIQVTNVSPSASSEQMRTLFGFLGKIDELRLFPPDDSPLPVSSRVCFVKFHDPDSAVVAQHLTNTVFVDRALIVVPYAEGVIPDETKALSLLAPANAVAGLLPGGGLLPTPNPLTQIGAVPLAALGAPTLDPALAALGLPGANLNSQSLAADQLLKLMSTVDPKLNHVAAGLVSPSLKSDTSSKEIEEAMKRVREAQSLISAAIEPDKKEEKRRHSRSRSRSRRRRTPSSSRHRRSRSRSRRRSHSKSRSRRRSKSPRRRRSHSRERGRRSRSTSKTRYLNFLEAVLYFVLFYPFIYLNHVIKISAAGDPTKFILGKHITQLMGTELLGWLYYQCSGHNNGNFSHYMLYSESSINSVNPVLLNAAVMQRGIRHSFL
ncbi:serine/arginine-rich splicing factor 11 isoform X4 [Lemur catta]|uniref:serine/arginine-rich splicing factor 11 isoform X4 n=1 Tax=Lemur catta TaxID=9447 RepID=UPI001E267C13|nr:serine/arginine-rich splicing factor 11 isoform X4 [Lemur catta]